MVRNSLFSLALTAIVCGALLAQGGSRRGCGSRSAGRTLAPRVASAEVPTYPIIAVEAGIAGTVRMRFTVRDGQVSKVEQLGSAPRMLATAAKENVESWRFSKGTNTVLETSFVFRISRQETGKAESPEILLDLPSLVTLCAKRLKLKPVVMYGH